MAKLTHLEQNPSYQLLANRIEQVSCLLISLQSSVESETIPLPTIATSIEGCQVLLSQAAEQFNHLNLLGVSHA
ncbi:hypothetical protein KDV38_09500 [Providencia rettgeri]